MEEYMLGLNTVARVVSIGCGAPGAILSDCSDEFVDIYNKSYIIISKGQGNYDYVFRYNGKRN